MPVPVPMPIPVLVVVVMPVVFATHRAARQPPIHQRGHQVLHGRLGKAGPDLDAQLPHQGEGPVPDALRNHRVHALAGQPTGEHTRLMLRGARHLDPQDLPGVGIHVDERELPVIRSAARLNDVIRQSESTVNTPSGTESRTWRCAVSSIHCPANRLPPAQELSIRPVSAATALPANRCVAPERLIHTADSREIAGGIWVTGSVPRETGFEDVGGRFYLDPELRHPDPLPDDQAVFFPTAAGTVVVLGCAHAGVVNTLRHVQRLTGGAPVRAVLGGMHLLQASETRLAATLDALAEFRIPLLVPGHCTGLPATVRLWQSAPGRCAGLSVGNGPFCWSPGPSRASVRLLPNLARFLSRPGDR